MNSWNASRISSTVKLTGMAHDCAAMTDMARRSAGTRHLIPETERAGSQQTVVSGSEQVTADTEQVEHESMHRQEALHVPGGFEPAHLVLALSSRLVRYLRSIVLVLPGAVHH